MSTAEEFRARVRAFFDGVPALLDAAGAPGDEDDPRQMVRAKAWRAALYDAGLAGFGYPVEHGGLGERPEEQAIYQQESRGRVPTVDSVFGLGVAMALPMIRDHGTEAMKARLIRPGLRGEEVWCQLYSEPNAGSDLASLATRAVRDGDEWIVTVRRCGPPARSKPTSPCCWPGRTPTCPSTAASPCS